MPYLFVIAYNLGASFWQEAASNALAQGEQLRALTRESLLSGLPSVKVVLPWLTRNELTIFGHLDTLGE